MLNNVSASAEGIESLEDLQLLQDESDYEEIGLTRFEKRKLKNVISSLCVSSDDGELSSCVPP